MRLPVRQEGQSLTLSIEIHSTLDANTAVILGKSLGPTASCTMRNLP